MSEHIAGRTRALGGSLGILPSHLRLSLQKYASDEALNVDPTGKMRIIPRSMMLDCDVITEPARTAGVVPNVDPFRGYEGDEPKLHGEDAHPHDDATGHVRGPHITDLPSWGNPDGSKP